MGTQPNYSAYPRRWNMTQHRGNGDNNGQDGGQQQAPDWTIPHGSAGEQTTLPETENTSSTLPGMTQMDPYVSKEYVQSDAVTKAQQLLLELQGQKPGAYESQWQGQLNDLLGQIQNRDKFQYDVNSDALYQQVMQNYLAQGQQAMMDTMGQAAAMTGGYGNSYAQTAGQQVYNQHLLGLAELVPQYQQMAMQQYQMEGDDLLSRYNLLAQQEDMAYGRYQDDLSRYYADLDRAQAAYDNERDYDYSRFADDRDFDYGKYQDELNYQYQLDRDNIADQQWIQQWEYQQERDRIADEQWQQEYDEMVRQFNENLAFQQSQAARSSGGGGSGGGGMTDYEYTEAILASGGYSSAEMLQIIRTSDLSKTEQDKLKEQYQEPKAREEVNAQDSRKDTSAYWSTVL